MFQKIIILSLSLKLFQNWFSMKATSSLIPRWLRSMANWWLTISLIGGGSQWCDWDESCWGLISLVRIGMDRVHPTYYVHGSCFVVFCIGWFYCFVWICSNSSALAMELPQYCTKPSILPFAMLHYFTHHVPERWRQELYKWQINMIFHLRQLNLEELIHQYFSIILTVYIISQYFNLSIYKMFWLQWSPKFSYSYMC